MKTVALVDDDLDFLTDLSAIVDSHAEFRVIANARSGREGMLVVEHFRPDLVIADIMMPNGDGLKLLKHIREGCKKYNPFIYIITAMQTSAIQEILSDLKVDFVDFKPIDGERIFKRLKCIHVAEPKLPHNYAPSRKEDISDIIDEVMDDFEIPTHLIGIEYIKTALFLMADDPILKRNVYTKVAAVYKCTKTSVSRNIQTAIEACMSSSMYRLVFGEERAENLIFLSELSAIVRKRI